MSYKYVAQHIHIESSEVVNGKVEANNDKSAYVAAYEDLENRGYTPEMWTLNSCVRVD